MPGALLWHGTVGYPLQFVDVKSLQPTSFLCLQVDKPDKEDRVLEPTRRKRTRIFSGLSLSILGHLYAL